MDYLTTIQTYGAMSLPVWGVLLIAYFLGSIPFGLLLGKTFLRKDIRKYGSHNIGSANLARIGGKKIGALTLLFDSTKGIVAVGVAQLFFQGHQDWVFISAILAVLGHVHPVWLRFKGGKGVATNFGVWLVLDMRVFVSLVIFWGLAFLAKRISSLAAITSLILTSILILIIDGFHIQALTCVFLSVYIIILHHENIKRIIQGNENKV